MIHRENIAILILAAGSSSRMKAIKQLLPWKDTTFLGNTIRIAKNSMAKDTLVVLGASADKIIPECQKENTDFIINEDWKEGMGTSIATGIQFLNSKGNVSYDGVLVLLCDQPFLNVEYINTLIATFKNSANGIVATKYEHGVGVPAVFHREYFKKLEGLSQDFGAKELLKTEKDRTTIVVPNFNTLDIDTDFSYKMLDL